MRFNCYKAQNSQTIQFLNCFVMVTEQPKAHVKCLQGPLIDSNRLTDGISSCSENTGISYLK